MWVLIVLVMYADVGITSQQIMFDSQIRCNVAKESLLAEYGYFRIDIPTRPWVSALCVKVS